MTVELPRCNICGQYPKYAMREYEYCGVKHGFHVIYCEQKLWKHRNEVDSYSKEDVERKWKARSQDMDFVLLRQILIACRDALLEADDYLQANESGRFDEIIKGCNAVLGE